MPKLGRALRATLMATVSLPLGITAASAAYVLDTTIGIPATAANNQGGAFTGFDISFFDSRGIYYIADRSNASVDIINGATNQVLAQAGGFAGQLSSTSISGPDGVAVGNVNGTWTLFAGDGGSTLRSFNVNNPSSPTALSTLNTGGGQFRVDEMALGPNGQIFVANNANSPSFGTIASTTQPLTALHTNIQIPGQVASGGMEGSVYNPTTGTYFVSVPTFNGTDPGGVQEFDTNGKALRTYNFSTLSGGAITNCSSSGIDIGASGNLMVGCNTGSAQAIVLDPTGSGSIVRTIPVSNTDELWYDPTTGEFALTGTSNTNGDRVIDLVNDATGALTQSIDLTSLGVGQSVNTHSVAIDPLNGDIFVPLEGTVGSATDTLCPRGCVAVFGAATPVPEPGSLPVVLAGAGGAARHDWSGPSFPVVVRDGGPARAGPQPLHTFRFLVEVFPHRSP